MYEKDLPHVRDYFARKPRKRKNPTFYEILNKKQETFMMEKLRQKGITSSQKAIKLKVHNSESGLNIKD